MRLLNARGEIAALLLAAAAAALAPFATRSSGAVASAPFPGWPTHYDGRALTHLPLTPREAGFTHLRRRSHQQVELAPTHRIPLPLALQQTQPLCGEEQPWMFGVHPVLVLTPRCSGEQ